MAVNSTHSFEELTLEDAKFVRGRGTARGPRGARGRRPQGAQASFRPLDTGGFGRSQRATRGSGHLEGTSGSGNSQENIKLSHHNGTRGSGYIQGTRSGNYQRSLGSINHHGSRGSGHHGPKGSGLPLGTRGSFHPHKTVGLGHFHGSRGVCNSQGIKGPFSFNDFQECIDFQGTQISGFQDNLAPTGTRGKAWQSRSPCSKGQSRFSVTPEGSSIDGSSREGSSREGNPRGSGVRSRQPQSQQAQGGAQEGSRSQVSGWLPKEPHEQGASTGQQRHQTLHGGQGKSRSSKKLFLLRGPPGSGKSTLARELLSEGPNGVVLSTDQFFCRNGRYKYIASRLEEAHTWNHEQAEDAMCSGKSPVIIDNTNLMFWEMKPYVLLALEYKYKVIFKEPKTQWLLNADELARRNTHGVTVEKIVNMVSRFERPASIDKVLNSK